LVVSPQIIEEYRETGEELAADFSGVDLAPWIQLLCIRATVVEAPALEEQVCSDPDDDKFLSCALAGRSQLIVSGDKALLRTSGYNGVTVLTPRKFVMNTSGKATRQP
jgi:predicted nucleic acid-binding protein